MKRLLGYFLKGLLIVLPVGFTAYFFVGTFRWIDNLAHINIPGLGLAILVVGITLVGFLLSGIVGSVVFSFLDELFANTPFIKLVYTSVRDLISAFVGEKKKFTEPVLVDIFNSGVKNIGFITRKDVAFLGVEGMTAVYFPDSYTFVGRVYLIPKERIIPCDANATETMKFIISAGITGFSESQ